MLPLGLFFALVGLNIIGVYSWRIAQWFRTQIGEFWENRIPPHETEFQGNYLENVQIAMKEDIVPNIPSGKRPSLQDDQLKYSAYHFLAMIAASYVIYALVLFGLWFLDVTDLVVIPPNENLPSENISTGFAILAPLLGPIFGILAISFRTMLNNATYDLLVILVAFALPSIFLSVAVRNLIHILEGIQYMVIDIMVEKLNSEWKGTTAVFVMDLAIFLLLSFFTLLMSGS